MDDLQNGGWASPLPVTSVTPQFLGRRGALFKLVFKNMLLTLLTVGIYRFWAKTRVRRYFWGNVMIAGEPLEYTGKATELLIGFLIVIAVLVPLSAVSSGLRVLAVGGPGWLGPVLNAAYFMVLLSLFDFATYRIWRYRLTRTRWRGIRFGMENGALRYTGRAFLWRLAQIATLGFITPWMRFDLARFRVGRMRLGDRSFALDGRAKPLVLRWLAAWGIPSVVVLGFFAFDYGTSLGVVFPGHAVSVLTAKRFLAAIAIAFAAGFILFVFYRIFEARYLIGCTRMDGVHFESTLRARSILPAFALAWGIVAVLFAALLVVVMIPVGLSMHGAVGAATGRIVGIVVGFAVAGLMLVLSPIITYPIAVFQAVRHVWTSLSIHGIEALDTVAQAPEATPRFGEGLADALDVGAI